MYLISNSLGQLVIFTLCIPSWLGSSLHLESSSNFTRIRRGINLSSQLVSTLNLEKSSNVTRFRRATCDAFEFQCANGQCIDSEFSCDGVKNCDDGSDETDSCKSIKCLSYMYTCDYGACINKDFECDGKEDCVDGSDEKNCGNIQTPSSCGSSEFTCKSGECIDELNLCDGVAHCKDASDETAQVCQKINCYDYNYRCKYGACVHEHAKCNGVKECYDNSDEENCKKPTPPPPLTTTKAPPVTSKTPTKPTPTPPTFPVGEGVCEIPRTENGKHVQYLVNTELKAGSRIPAGVIVVPVCLPGFATKPKTDFLICGENGWENPVPECVRICRPLRPSKDDHYTARCRLAGEGVSISCETPYDGTIAELKCESLYEDPSLALNNRRVCKDGSWDYSKPSCRAECGFKFVPTQEYVIGGAIAQAGHYPWTVGIYTEKNKEHICGGSLISENLVVTAAHCFIDGSANKKPASEFVIAAGKHFRRYDHESDIYAQYANVKSLFIMKTYKGLQLNHLGDIAVLVLDRKVPLNPSIRPVCVDWRLFNPTQLINHVGVVTGWGYTESTGNPSTELKEVNVTVLSEDDCKKNVAPDYRKYVLHDKICALGIVNGSTACKGDSGGGLVFRDDRTDRYYIRGVVSNSPRDENQGCNTDTVVLYTSFSEYRDEINDIQAINH